MSPGVPLDKAYRAAWEEWDADEDNAAWDEATGDGLDYFEVDNR